MPARRKTAKKKSGSRSTRKAVMPNLNITSPSQFKQLTSVIGKHPVVLVLVYANWCGHCQSFKPDWKNLSKTPARNMPMVAVRDDVFKNSPLNNLVSPEGFPTVAVASKANNVSVNLPTRDPEVLESVVTNANTLTTNTSNGASFNMNINNLLKNNGNNNNNNSESGSRLSNTNLTEEYSLNTKKTTATRVTNPITRDTIEPPMGEEAYKPSSSVSASSDDRLLSQTMKSPMNMLGGGLFERLLRRGRYA